MGRIRAEPRLPPARLAACSARLPIRLCPSRTWPAALTVTRSHSNTAAEVTTMNPVHRRRPIRVIADRLAPTLATFVALVLVGCTPSDDPVAAGDCAIPAVSLHFGKDNPHLEDMFNNDAMGTRGKVIEYHDEPSHGPSDGSPPTAVRL